MEYYRIKYFENKEYIERCVNLLKPLRKGLNRQIPKRQLNETLIFGTWNIREFDGNNKKYGPRKEDDFFYIAEIISRFDLLAIQEINEDLTPLKKVLKILGRNYEYIVTDVSAWKAGGNNERLGFIYDKRTVHFKGLAGELVLPQNMLIRNNDGKVERQFSRTPFKCSFQAGWFKFKVTTVHIYFGEESESSNKFRRRVDEIDKVAKVIANNAKKESKNTEDRTWFNPYNYFIVGDFNIVDEDNVSYDALANNGFKTVKNIKGSNRSRTKFYDQISYYKTTDLDFDWKESNKSSKKDKNNWDRTFNFFNYIYTDAHFPLFKKDVLDYVRRSSEIFLDENKKLNAKLEDIKAKLNDATLTPSRRKRLLGQQKKAQEKVDYHLAILAEDEGALRKFYNTSPWNTFQISDHLPLWVEIDIDKSEEYLNSGFQNT